MNPAPAHALSRHDEMARAATPNTTPWTAWYLPRPFAQHFRPWREFGAAWMRRCSAGLALTAEMRHNVFLAFKEALHNVVKTR